MVDTQVIILACMGERPKLSRDVLEMQQRAKALLAKIRYLNLSAVTWIELLRYGPETERQKVEALHRNFRVLPVDQRVAELTARLLADHRKRPRICQKCGVDKQSNECPACKLRRGGQQRFQDAAILATAEVFDVPILFSFDGPMAELHEGLTVKIQKPPNPDGPLFENSGPR